MILHDCLWVSKAKGAVLISILQMGNIKQVLGVVYVNRDHINSCKGMETEEKHVVAQVAPKLAWKLTADGWSLMLDA